MYYICNKTCADMDFLFRQLFPWRRRESAAEVAVTKASPTSSSKLSRTPSYKLLTSKDHESPKTKTASGPSGKNSITPNRKIQPSDSKVSVNKKQTDCPKQLVTVPNSKETNFSVGSVGMQSSQDSTDAKSTTSSPSHSATESPSSWWLLDKLGFKKSSKVTHDSLQCCHCQFTIFHNESLFTFYVLLKHEIYSSHR